MKPTNSFVKFIIEQIHDAGNISCKSMFGGYTIYCNDKIVALICDNRFFVKPTKNGKKKCGTVKEASPYPGAKPCFLIEDNIEDKEWLCELIRETAMELPTPIKKKTIRKGKIK